MDITSLTFNPYFFGAAIILGIIYGYFALPLNRKILSENMPEVQDKISTAENNSGHGFFFDKELVVGNIKGIQGVKVNRGKWYLSLFIISSWYLAIVIVWISILVLVFNHE
jgi:hypothetical protein